MTRDNLSILISPCLGWSEEEDIFKEIVKSKLLIKTTDLLFIHFDKIFF